MTDHDHRSDTEATVAENHVDSNNTASTTQVEQMSIGENGQSEDEIVYPSGAKVWFAVGALYTAFFLNGLVCYAIMVSMLKTYRIKDLTIVAVAVPSLTNHFKSVDDIGWYSAA